MQRDLESEQYFTLSCLSGPQIKMRKLFFLFLNQNICCVGTQKNRLNETVLLSTKTHVLTDG